MSSIALGSINKGLVSSRAISAVISSVIEKPSNHLISGSRLENLRVQTAAYGKVIPIIFGHSKLAGNIIWALPIKEQEHRHVYGSGKALFGKRSTTTHLNYSYSVSIAIGLCEGVIDSIINVWADAKNITHEIRNFRIYKGTEDQLPDPLIEAHQGIGKTPAYRGLAYMVIENFSLEDYGNQIPNFTFEIKRRGGIEGNIKDRVEDNVSSICIIPGSGEFVYDTDIAYKVNINDQGVQTGKAMPINMNNGFNKADCLVSLDQLQETCSNIKWVAPVVGWFATSLNLVETIIAPGIEFEKGATTSPNVWEVGEFKRSTAHKISLKDHLPIYGGTISDSAILRYLNEVKKRNIKTMFYPMIFVDLPDKPWRGHITGSANDVYDFFHKKNGYNDFIVHYATLVKGTVDAFVIGSEMIGITSIRDKDGGYPAIGCLVDLAKRVKDILGPEVIVTYAADWSEYHHTDGGFYNLDELWMSENIDVIGIDAYFPLTEGKNDNLSEKDIINAWEKGECYDFYYDHNGKKQKLSPAYAIKNIKYWWENFHYNPDGVRTTWIPKSKKIWFTEFGFPSLDNASNQPNVFFDPESYDGGLPKGSDGISDFYTQRISVSATLKKWANSEMVTNMFLWCWDARPYPSWPMFTNIWGDSHKWEKGHWVNGKFGVTLLRDVILELCLRVGLKTQSVDVSRLVDVFEGVAFNERFIVADIIDLLAKLYCFEVVQLENKLVFMPNSSNHVKKIDSRDLVYAHSKKLLEISYSDPQTLPAGLELMYVDKRNHYRQNIARSERRDAHNHRILTIYSNIVLSKEVSEKMSDKILTRFWQERLRYQIILPFKYISLNPGDIIDFGVSGFLYRMKITKISLVSNRCLEIEGKSFVLEDKNYYILSHFTPIVNKISTNLISHILNLPLAKNNNPHIYLAVAVSAGEFRPIVLHFVENHLYEQVAIIHQEATIGTVINELSEESDSVKVVLIAGSLKSTNEAGLFLGSNTAVIGNEIIQFLDAEFLGNSTYVISGFVRGKMFTENFINSHKERERFVLLDDAVIPIEIPEHMMNRKISYKLVPNGVSPEDIKVENFFAFKDDYVQAKS